MTFSSESSLYPLAQTKRIFVSDLDGTLLRNNATLSDFARQSLREMLLDGLHFTVATGRSVISTQQILGDLPLPMPVICSNGACVSDLASGHHRFVNALEKPLDRDIFYLMREKGLNPFVSSFNGKEEHLYIDHVSNAGMDAYYQDRVATGDSRMRTSPDVATMLSEQIICMNAIDRVERLRDMAMEMEERYPARLQVYLYEDWYSRGWYWLSMYDRLATKAYAIEVLMREYGYSANELTVFGDNINDLPMFHLAGKRIAPANAIEEVLQIADETIEANETDSVVNYLRKATGRYVL
ncbi:MAG: HAD-IIB family hydrolase [Bacteroidetes bacterium]|nr:MAG: HAD-IIB family hydrolase [Bacteroidota bacterium]